MTDREIHHINYNSKFLSKCKFAFKLIGLFHFIYIRSCKKKCQCCQICVLWENSDGGEV